MAANPWRMLTGRGRTLLVVGPVVAGLGSWFGEPEFVPLGVLLTLVPLVGLLGLVRRAPRLTVQRTVQPARVAVGGRMQASLRLVPQGWSVPGVFSFEESLPSGLGRRPRFGSGWLRGAREVTYPLVGGHRGHHQVGPLLIRLTDVFGTARIDRAFRTTVPVAVTPPIVRLATPTEGGIRSLQGDLGLGLRSGLAGQDDALVREYRDGDDRRRVHWRSTARRGELMVRREQEPSEPSAAVWIDQRSSQHCPGQRPASFEWAVTAATSIAICLLDKGHRLELAGSGGPLAGSAGGLQDLGHDQVVDAMTDVTVDPEERLELGPLQTSSSGRLLVAVTGRLDGELTAALTLAGRGRGRRLALVVDPDTFVGSAQRVASPVRKDFEACLSRLSAAGWQVAVARRGDDLAPVWQALVSGSTGGRG